MITFNAEKHEYRLDGQPIPSVTRTLKEAGVAEFNCPNADVLDRALKFGRAVHLTCELFDRNDLNEEILDSNLKGYLDAWRKFLKDTDFKIEAIEERVVSKRLWYAGTLDRRGILNGKRAVIDIKTGVDFGPATALQLAAYQNAWNEGKPIKEKIKTREVVQLKADGTYALAPDKFFAKSDFSVFLSALTIRNWRKRCKV